MSMKEYLEIFIRHVEKLAETDHYGDDGYTREFQTLKQRSAQYKINGTYSTEEGEKEWNKRKNRFKDILPYDYTRVKLVAVPGVSGSDYINANFLKGPNGQHMYIASQGPLLHTKVDFWRMVWEYDVSVVVMACNEYEGEKLKCARYWPQVGKSEKYGKITVRFEKEEKENQDFCIRHMVAEYAGVNRTIWQFHYGGWPDHGTPNIPSVLEMISVMRERQASPLPPIVVHCSAGCGRTGTICAIDYAWHVLKLGLLNAEFGLFNIIDEMRTQRNAIVQTKDQYVSVHHAVRDLFARHLEVINEHSYENLAVNGQVPPSGQEYETVSAYDDSQYSEPNKTKHTTLTPPNQESPTERAIYSTVANLINANQIGTGNGGEPPSPPEPAPDPHYVAITMKDYKAYASDDEVLQSKDSGEEQHSPPVTLPHYATSHRPTNRNLEGNTLEAPAPPPRSSSIRRTVSDEPIANHLKPESNLELGDSSNSQESGGTPGTKETLGLLTDYIGQNSDDWSSSAAGSQDGGEVLCDDKPDLLPDLPPPPPRPACMVKPTDRSSTNTQNVNHYYNIADLQTNQVSMDEVASSSPTECGSGTDMLLEPPPLPPKLSDNESDEPDGYQMNTVIRGGGSRAHPTGPPKPPHSSDAERCKSSPIRVSSPVHSSSSVHTSSPGLSSSPLHNYDLLEHRQSPALSYQEDPRNSPHHAHNQQWMQDPQVVHSKDNRASPMYEVLSKFRSGPSVDHQQRQMVRSVDDADDESEEEVPQVPVRLYKTMPHPGKQQRRRRQQQLQLLLQQQQQEQAYAQRQESPYHMGDLDRSSPGVVMIRNPAFSASMTQAELSPKLSPSRASDHPMPPLQNQLNDINKPGLPQKTHLQQDSRFQTYIKHEGPIEKRLSNIQLDDPIYGFHGQPQQQYHHQQAKNRASYAEGHYKVPSNHYPRDYHRQYSGSPTRNEMAHDPQNLCHHHQAQQQQHVNQGDQARLPSTGDPDMEFAYNKDDGDYVSLRVKQQQQQQLLQRQQQQIALQQNLDKQAAVTDEGAYGYAYVSAGGGKPAGVAPQGPAPVKPPRRKRRPHSVSAADMSERMEREVLRHRASARMEESCEGALGIPDTYQPVEGAIGANHRMTRSSYGEPIRPGNTSGENIPCKNNTSPYMQPTSTSEDSLQGPDIPYKTPEAYFPAHQAVLDIISGMEDHQIPSQDESSAADSMTSSVIQFGKKIKRVVMGQGLSASNHSDIKPVHTKDIYFKGKLINFPHRVDRPRRPAAESPYEVPRSTQVHRK